MVLLISGATGIAGETAAMARERGDSVLTVALEKAEINGDLAGGDTAERAVSECLKRHGRIDALFNCAGISGRRYGDGPLDRCTDEGWDRTMSANVRSLFLLTRAALKPMLEQGSGAILNMASVVAFSPEPRHFAAHAYAAGKGAIIALTRSMAAYYAPHGIRVNAIAPGLVRTPMSARAQQNEEILEFLKHKQPLAADLLDAADIARAALFLLSPESRTITGQVLTVDGGWHVSA